MLSWFKTKIWQPIKGFFKDLFGFTALEKELTQARKDTKEVLELYDNLTEGNRELIYRFNKLAKESSKNVRDAHKVVQESRENIQRSTQVAEEQRKRQKELDQVVETHKKVFFEVLKKLPKTCPNPGHKRRFSIG